MAVYLRRKKNIQECDGGIGNPAPAQSAAMTGAEQCSPSCLGSGDNFGNQISKVTTKDTKKKQ